VRALRALVAQYVYLCSCSPCVWISTAPLESE
jgi:hypothetical protein